MKSTIWSTALVMSLLMGSAQAAELATTSTLPPALRAINGNRSRILTSSEAEKIRGEGRGRGHAWGHSKRGGVHSGINFGVIGGHTVILHIENSKNVRIGSHNHLKFK